MTGTVAWLIQNAAVATVAALLVAVLVRRWRPPARWEHLLWLLVAAKFVWPAVVAIPVPMPSLAEFRVTSAASDRSVLRTSPVDPPVSVTQEAVDGRTTGDGPVVDSPDVTAVDALRWIGALWLASGIAVLAMRLASLLRWHRARRLRPAPPRLRSLVQAVARDAGVAAPAVVVDESLSAPVITGLLRPRLLWPASLLRELAPQRARTVVAHELAHARRGDMWVGVLELLVDALWWWYPAWHLVRRRLRDASERACDDVVVMLYPQLRRTYAEALLDVAAANAVRPALALGLDGPGPIQRRLSAIMAGEAHAGRRRAAVLVAVSAVLLTPAWRPVAADPFDGAALSDRAAWQPAGPAQDALIAVLARAVADPEPAVRRAAANALRANPGSAAAELLRELADDADAEVRHAARAALGLEPRRPNLDFPGSRTAELTRSAVDSLTAGLRSGSADTRLSAARRLGNARDRRAVPALIAALVDVDPGVRQAAADALGNTADPAAAGPLARLLADPHPRVRQGAAGALASTGGAEHVSALARAFDDADVHVRQSAASALGGIGERIVR